MQSRPRRHKKQFARRRRRTTPTTSVLDDDDDDDDAKKAEQVGVTLVVFANARENSCLKYPKSLPDYKSDDSTKKADDFVPWKDVWEHVGRRLRWSNDAFETIVLDCADEDEMSSERAMEACSKATCFIACDVGENADVATHMSRLTAPIPTGVVVGTSSETLRAHEKLQFMPMNAKKENQFDIFEMPFETRREKDKKKFFTNEDVIREEESFGFTVHEFSVDRCVQVPGITVPEVAINQEINIGNVWCIAYNCGSKLLDCYKNPRCRKSLDCVDACGMNDQVCTYVRAIARTKIENLNIWPGACCIRTIV